MLKELMTKFFAFFFLASVAFTSANALDVSALKQEEDGEATITFCKTLKIENVFLDNSSLVQTVIFEKDEGKFENIALLNSTIANKIISCFEGVCDMRTSCNKVPYSLISATKVKDKDLVIAKVAFDNDISATFLVSSYKKKDKTLYRVRMPQDLEFSSWRYKRTLRDWLIKETKGLL